MAERAGAGGVTTETILEDGVGDIEVAVLRTSFSPGAVVPLHAHPEAVVATMPTLLPGSPLAHIREIAAPLGDGPVARSTRDLVAARLAERIARCDLNASQVENAAIGIVLSP